LRLEKMTPTTRLTRLCSISIADTTVVEGGVSGACSVF
jgi:hypothetical protein